MKIKKALKEDFEKLADLWEASVRASHFFLAEDDIPALKAYIPTLYFPVLSLYLCRDENGLLLGFIGVTDRRVEMLFVAPESWGKGVGRLLLFHAVREMGAKELDVNEENPDALAFYLHMGFGVVGRSSLDGQGRAYPLLHMELKKTSNQKESDLKGRHDPTKHD